MCVCMRGPVCMRECAYMYACVCVCLCVCVRVCMHACASYRQFTFNKEA